MKAMILLHHDTRLRQLGFKLVLQIHNEVVLEGPEANVTEALSIVKRLMENPFKKPLLVGLEVDINAAKTLYQAK